MNDKARCSERVIYYVGNWPRFKQCTKAAKVEKGGKHFCTIHDPDYIAQKRAQKDKEWREKFDKEYAQRALERSAPLLRDALTALLDRYVSLVNCGDCGNWNPETEDQVIAARAALANARGEK